LVVAAMPGRRIVKPVVKQTTAEWLRDYDEEGQQMSNVATSKGGGDFKKCPPGTHQAVCDMVVGLGEQPTTYQGQDTGLKFKIYLRWEVPHERVEYEVDGNKIEGPMTIGKTYTLSLSQKANLRKDLEAWRGTPFTPEDLKGFDIDAVLGQCCQIIVTQTEKDDTTYANVAGVAGWPQGLPRIKAENELIAYGADNTAQYDLLPGWIKGKLNGGGEQSAEETQTGAPEEFDDDIPF
jgi:hypothetical protein